MATKPVKKPRKPRAKRKAIIAAQPVEIDLLRQGDFEVGFRPNLRPVQQASLLGNLLTNVSNQEKLSALSASLKQYEKQLEESKKSPNIVTTAEEVKPVALASSQVGRLRDIKFVERKTKQLEEKEFKQNFPKQMGIETTLEEDLDLSEPLQMGFGQQPPSGERFFGRRSVQLLQAARRREASETIPVRPVGDRPQPLATLQRRPTPELPSISRQITKEEVMADVRRQNVDLRSAQRIPEQGQSMYE